MPQGTRAVVVAHVRLAPVLAVPVAAEAVEASLAMLEVEASVATVVEVAVVAVAEVEPPLQA